MYLVLTPNFYCYISGNWISIWRNNSKAFYLPPIPPPLPTYKHTPKLTYFISPLLQWSISSDLTTIEWKLAWFCDVQGPYLLKREKTTRSLKAMSIHSVIWHIFFNFEFFCHLDWKLRIQSIKYDHIRDQEVNFSRKRHLTCLVSKNVFGGHFDFFFRKRGSPYWRKLPTDLADFK